MVEFRPECGIWCKEDNNHPQLKRQKRLIKGIYNKASSPRESRTEVTETSKSQ